MNELIEICETVDKINELLGYETNTTFIEDETYYNFYCVGHYQRCKYMCKVGYNKNYTNLKYTQAVCINIVNRFNRSVERNDKNERI